jgi:hypothetical protein
LSRFFVAVNAEVTAKGKGFEISPEYQNKYQGLLAEKWTPQAEKLIAALRNALDNSASHPQLV